MLAIIWKHVIGPVKIAASFIKFVLFMIFRIFFQVSKIQKLVKFLLIKKNLKKMFIQK